MSIQFLSSILLVNFNLQDVKIENMNIKLLTLCIDVWSHRYNYGMVFFLDI